MQVQGLNQCINQCEELMELNLDVLLFPDSIDYNPITGKYNQETANRIAEIANSVKWHEALPALKYTAYKRDSIQINHYQMLQMHNKCCKILAENVPEHARNRDTILGIETYLAQNVTYDRESLKGKSRMASKDGISIGPVGGANGAYNAIMLDQCVCEGYTRAMQYLLKLKGINSRNVRCIGTKDTLHLADKTKETIYTRYELPDEVMKDVNKYMYEAKFIGRVGPFRDKVRTFCQNPSGFVSAEVYDNNLTLVNGHSYKEIKSTNTNLAILVSHHFTHPFKKPIEYGRNVAQNLNDLGAGNIVVQRLGDIYRGKRTWDYELEKNSVVPTLKSAVAGDITFALGYRTMVSILEFIRAVDKVVEGFGNPDNLLYAPEIKFYSNKVVIDKNFETSVKGLYSIGDGGGMTRGLMMASCSGIQMARNL